jgi:hypothetical protein
MAWRRTLRWDASTCSRVASLARAALRTPRNQPTSKRKEKGDKSKSSSIRPVAQVFEMIIYSMTILVCPMPYFAMIAVSNCVTLGSKMSQ